MLVRDAKCEWKCEWVHEVTDLARAVDEREPRDLVVRLPRALPIS